MTEPSNTELNWSDIHALWLDFRSTRPPKESYQRSISAFFKYKIGDDIPKSDWGVLHAELTKLKKEHDAQGNAYNTLFKDTHEISKALAEQGEQLEEARHRNQGLIEELDTTKELLRKNAASINEDYVLREHFEGTKDTLNRSINKKDERIKDLETSVTILGVFCAGLVMVLTYTQFIL